MKKPKISVIIPVYNTRNYIRKCLQSILDQKIDDVEIIIINDASTDDSLKVIENFVGNDHHFIIVNKLQNAGVEEARILGINMASGEYLCFVDSDDWLPKNSLKVMFNNAEKNNADIVVGNVNHIFDRLGIIKKEGQKFCQQITVLDKKVFFDNYYIGFFGINIFPVAMWGKLYKTSFVQKKEIKLLGYSLGEDLNYNIQIFSQAERIVLIPAIVYCYRYGGMTSKFNDKIIPAAIKMYNMKREVALDHNSEAFNKYSKIELKNYLKTYIEMFLKFKTDQSAEEHKKQILEIINQPEFLELKEYYSLQKKLEGFELAFSNGDLVGMYQHVIAAYEKIKVQYKIKRYFSKLIT